MDSKTKIELLLNAIRWTSNILVEVLSAYGSVDDTGRNHLRDAVMSLEKAAASYRSKQ
jgi:hypothetical protein